MNNDLLHIFIGCAAGLTVAAAIICAKAWGALREAKRRSARLARQSADLEAAKLRLQTFTLAAQCVLKNSELFLSPRKFETV